MGRGKWGQGGEEETKDNRRGNNCRIMIEAKKGWKYNSCGHVGDMIIVGAAARLLESTLHSTTNSGGEACFCSFSLVGRIKPVFNDIFGLAGHETINS